MNERERQNLSERVDERVRGVWECETKRRTVRENLCVRQSVCESEREGERRCISGSKSECGNERLREREFEGAGG